MCKKSQNAHMSWVCNTGATVQRASSPKTRVLSELFMSLVNNCSTWVASLTWCQHPHLITVLSSASLTLHMPHSKAFAKPQVLWIHPSLESYGCMEGLCTFELIRLAMVVSYRFSEMYQYKSTSFFCILFFATRGFIGANGWTFMCVLNFISPKPI